MAKSIKTGQDTEVDGSTSTNLIDMLQHLNTCLHVDKESGKRKYDEILGRISQTTTLADARDCDLIIEVSTDAPSRVLASFLDCAALYCPTTPCRPLSKRKT